MKREILRKIIGGILLALLVAVGFYTPFREFLAIPKKSPCLRQDFKINKAYMFPQNCPAVAATGG